MSKHAAAPVDKIVPVDQIPKVADILDVPLDDLMAVYKVCLRMEMLCEHETGIGLSAVQIGIPWKLFIIKAVRPSFKYAPINKYSYFVNCEYEIIEADGRRPSVEGCLSLRKPDGDIQKYEVERGNKIRLFGKRLVVASSLSVEDIDDQIDIEGLSIPFQHEIDHHRGILISDIGKACFSWQE